MIIQYEGSENIHLRSLNEFEYLRSKYSNIAFNCNTWDGVPNDKAHGKTILLSQEGYITMPNNYTIDTIKKYDAYITYNRKLKELNSHLNIFLINGPLNWCDYFWLEEFKDFGGKIRGVMSMQTVYNTGRDGDINYLKHTVMNELDVEPHLILHTYGPAPFGKPGSYQGSTGKTHSHYKNLEVINNYLFCWCPEPMYHPYWSYDYITERLFNCFKSKTIAIYYGCYNVEDHIPDEIYIDYRKFESVKHLSEYLIDLTANKKKYTDIVESAYLWNLKNKFGVMRYNEPILKEVSERYKM